MEDHRTLKLTAAHKPRRSVRAFGSRRGFTLVEMLVVMGIIAVLSAVAFTGYRAALGQAYRAKCSSNLRQIGVGMIAFAGDNNQYLPMSGVTIAHGHVDNPLPAGSGKPSWTEQLEPYLGPSTDTVANSVYTCPESSKTVAGNSQYSYFNGCHAAMAQEGHFAPVNLEKIHSLSNFIMSGDCSFGGFETIDADKDDYTQDPAFAGSTPTHLVTIPIHSGKSNVLFGDGHVESLKYFDPTENTTMYQGPGAAYTYLYGN